MAKYYRKKAGIDAFIPGVGRLREGQILCGDAYAKFVPAILEETVPPEPPKAAKVPSIPIPKSAVMNTMPPPPVKRKPKKKMMPKVRAESSGEIRITDEADLKKDTLVSGEESEK